MTLRSSSSTHYAFLPSTWQVALFCSLTCHSIIFPHLKMNCHCSFVPILNTVLTSLSESILWTCTHVHTISWYSYHIHFASPQFTIKIHPSIPIISYTYLPYPYTLICTALVMKDISSAKMFSLHVCTRSSHQILRTYFCHSLYFGGQAFI